MVTDEELARQLQAGNEAALEALVHRYHARIFGYVYRLVNDYHETQDIVQECFIRACGGIGRYSYPRPFKPWIYAIATNLCRDWAKSAYRRRVVLAEPGEGGDALAAGEPRPQDSVPSPDEFLQRQAERAAMMRALASLPEINRQVLVLRFYEELKITEIADVLGIPEGTVKSRLAAAVRQLRDALCGEEKGGEAIGDAGGK